MNIAVFTVCIGPKPTLVLRHDSVQSRLLERDLLFDPRSCVLIILSGALVGQAHMFAYYSALIPVFHKDWGPVVLWRSYH